MNFIVLKDISGRTLVLNSNKIISVIETPLGSQITVEFVKELGWFEVEDKPASIFTSLMR